MDRNTVIGFILIGALLIGMFVINSKSRLAYEGEQKRIADSIAATKPKVDTVAAKIDSAQAQTVAVAKQTGAFQSGNIAEQTIVLENEVLKIAFTNKGAQPKNVELKKYKKLDGSPVFIQQGNFNKLSYKINAEANRTAETADIIFQASPVVENADKSKMISFTAGDSLGRQIKHQYTIRPNDYMIDLNITVKGADQLFSQNSMSFLWQDEAAQIEKDHNYEMTQTHICYVENNDYDFEYVGSGDDMKFSKPVDWISVKQQFFATALIAKNKFTSAKTTGPFLPIPIAVTLSVQQRMQNMHSQAVMQQWYPCSFIMGPVIIIS